MSDQTNIFYVDLGPEALQDGKWFDGMSVGEFTDMWGSEVEIKDGDLDAYVENTVNAIRATITESGELVGLPIDSRNHDRGDAAGWITDVRRMGTKIQFLPKWTKIGVDLISNGIMRFFSATFNLKQKVIVGGTLTNWPATRNEKEQILLKPIELASGFVTFAEVDAAPADEPKELHTTHEELPMENFEELAAQVKDDVLAELTNLKVDEGQLNATVEAVAKKFEEINLQTAELIEQQVELRLQAQLAERKKKAEVAEFCAKMDKLPIQSDELETFMLSLTDEQREAAENFFGRISESGLTDFREHGHGRELGGKEPLPAGVESVLKGHLERGGKLAEFFAYAGIGEMDKYDLSAYQESK